ncbi:unnamed protein product [Urochloa humidicola]
MIPWILSPRVAGSPGAAAPALLTFPSHDPLSPAATPCARGEVPLPIFHPGPMLEPDHLPSRSISSVGRSRPFLASPLLLRSITAAPWFQMARVCSASSTLERSKLSGGLDRFLGKLQVSEQSEHKSRDLSELANLQCPSSTTPRRKTSSRVLIKPSGPALDSGESVAAWSNRGRMPPIIRGGRGFRAVGAEMSRLDSIWPTAAFRLQVGALDVILARPMNQWHFGRVLTYYYSYFAERSAEY